jgi:hypothetical protein
MEQWLDDDQRKAEETGISQYSSATFHHECTRVSAQQSVVTDRQSYVL